MGLNVGIEVEKSAQAVTVHSAAGTSYESCTAGDWTGDWSWGWQCLGVQLQRLCVNTCSSLVNWQESGLTPGTWTAAGDWAGVMHMPSHICQCWLLVQILGLIVEALFGTALVRMECDRAGLSLLECANGKICGAISSTICRVFTAAVLAVGFLSRKGCRGSSVEQTEKSWILSKLILAVLAVLCS